MTDPDIMDIVTMLRAPDRLEPHLCAAAANEIERLRKVLDAAKRVMCRDEATIRLQRHRVHRDSEDVVGLAKEIAVERGWDCFKDNPCPRTQT